MTNTRLEDLISQCQEGISGIEKSAFEKSTVQDDSDLASSIEHLLKQAHDSTEGKDEMRKEAREAGIALAYDILKQANMSPALLAEMAAEQDAASLDAPQGTLNQIKDQLIQRAVRPNAVEPDSEAESALEGITEADAEAASPIKTAAVRELVNRGFDFGTAAALVKAATEGEETFAAKARRKAGEYYDSAKSGAGKAYESTKSGAGRAYNYTKGKVTGLGTAVGNYTKEHPYRLGGGLVAGAAGLAGAAYGVGKYRKNRAAATQDQIEQIEAEKTAAVVGLVNEGYSFDEAVDFVKSAGEKTMFPGLTRYEKLKNFAREHWKAGVGGAAALGAVAGGAAYLHSRKKQTQPLDGSLTPAGMEEYSEKTAATYNLINQGYSFEDAVEMVKSASQTGYEIPAMEKLAYVDELVSNGYSYDNAVDMVKAAEYEALAELNGNAGENIHEKMASAVEGLVEEGIDYDTAVELVNEAANGRIDL